MKINVIKSLPLYIEYHIILRRPYPFTCHYQFLCDGLVSGFILLYYLLLCLSSS